ncbi:hypothetical protein CEXT_188891 [Caerostris extrusa]|uniref:Uncharacterized protein n=1 Tax=Caerostris extrusa TaxID=172846 RepID=A0AAV4NSP5_CAEEX|nr:hypothetical protein CEXT_188891 [Caerostris extrusa]
MTGPASCIDMQVEHDYQKCSFSIHSVLEEMRERIFSSLTVTNRPDPNWTRNNAFLRSHLRHPRCGGLSNSSAVRCPQVCAHFDLGRPTEVGAIWREKARGCFVGRPIDAIEVGGWGW